MKRMDNEINDQKHVKTWIDIFGKKIGHFLLICIGVVIGIIIMWFFIIWLIDGEGIWSGIGSWLKDYSGFLSALVACVLVIITAYYAKSARSQADSSEKSLKLVKEQTELVSRQILLEKQPYVIPSIIFSRIIPTKGFSILVCQLDIQCKCINVSSEPALSVFLFGYIEIPKIDGEDPKIIQSNISAGPSLCLLKDNEMMIHLGFINGRLSPLYEKLGITCDDFGNLNTRQDKRPPFPKLVVTTLYRNLVGQWFKISLQNEIWGIHQRCYKEDTLDKLATTETKNEIEQKRYELILNSPWNYAPFLIEEATLDDVKRELKEYGNEMLYGKLEYNEDWEQWQF